MKLTFLGAAGEVTGSQHLIETSERRLLLDCGMFQGHREASRLKNEQFHCRPKDLDGVILSHAHTDHAGNLPGLYKAGYRGPIFCTPATADVAAVMLYDSAKIQAEDARYLSRKLTGPHPSVEPLYDESHVEGVIKRFETLPYGQWHDLAPDTKVRFTDAGHILGSAIVELDMEDNKTRKRIVFTGDLGRRGIPMLRDPVRVDGGDVLITESTYADRIHAPSQDIEMNLEGIIRQTADRGGRVIIPAFSLGRTQTLVYFLNRLFNKGVLPKVPVYVDSPLSKEITSVYRRHTQDLDVEFQRTLQTDQDPFLFPGLRYVQSASESAGLNHLRDPFVVIASSGMCESGRIVHHLKHGVSDERNTIVMIGFQAAYTLGRKIQERHPHVRIFDREQPLRAQVESLSGLSAHADAEDFKWWFQRLIDTGGVGEAFIVHGEDYSRRAMAGLLENVSNEPPRLPQFGETFEV
ncbi:MAG TPA: MBL fold metallo-hydrolase [Planctomycetaceae bacterium]|nr:MBL fold metallo-hydrolase [Planctomycetaceae bacterium]